ncbi:MAG TPA: hypothetical protein VMG10_26755 [Gemmataceae bacterium]|nr:hypothetical protein [Gemmataceae bacterium]
MTSWLLRQLNITDEFVSHLDEARLAFQHPLVLTVGLVLLLPIAVYIFLRQKWNLPTVPPLLRFVLTATRVLILLSLVVILGSPYLKIDHTSEKKPIIALLFDHSQSMQLHAGPFESEEYTSIAAAAGYRATNAADSETRRALNRISRAKLAQSVVQTSRTLLEKLSGKYDVQYWSFGKDMTQLGVNPAEPKLPEPPNPGSSHTQLGDALGRILEDASGRQVAGIVLFSDGQNTGGRSPTEAAQTCAAAGTPLFTVPAGSSQRLQDVVIVDLFTVPLVSVNDTARVAVTVESHGFDKRPVKVELKDGDNLLDSKELILSGAEQQQIELTFKAAEPGARYLTVHIPPQPEEAEELKPNNTDTAFVRVSEEKIKMLFVEGLPRWDFRFLKNALRRDHGVGGRTAKEVDIRLEAEWRRHSADERAKALPRTLDQLAEYQVVILGDVSPKMLDAGFVDVLDKAVRERGVGLIVEAGPLSMPHRYGEQLHKLLPVRLREGMPGQYPRGIPSFRVELTPEGAIHEAMRFYDEPGRNQNAWANMPPYYWCAAAERPAPGATVLAVNPIANSYGKQPLIAYHYAGKGKVMFVGTDSTWLWRRNVGDRFFYRFWGQGLRFMARRDAKTEKKSWIEVRPVRAQPNEQAHIELMAFSSDGSPQTEDRQAVQIQGGGSATTVELTADPAVKGRYTGKFTPKQAGEYRVAYNPTGAADPVEARLRVTVAPEELRQPNVNRPALEQWANASGGQTVELPDLASIADRLQGESKLTELHREASLWDNWLTLAILIFLYSLDVGLRRLVGLS